MTPIYLDEQATTLLDPQVRAAMAAAPGGNPHSAHRHGAAAHAAVEHARAQVAALIAAPPHTIAFTSGATEANNMALIGVMTAPGQARRGLVTIATEHSAVLEPARWLATLGVELTILPVGVDGLMRLEDVAAAIGPGTALVSAMLVNNEIGVMQPVAEIAALAHGGGSAHALRHGAGVRTDTDRCGRARRRSAQHLGAQDLRAAGGGRDVPARRRGARRHLLHGGGQEPGRSGTVAVALAVGLGVAARIAGERMAEDAAHVESLWQLACAGLGAVEHRINGSVSDQRWRGNLNVRFPGVDGGRLLSDVTRAVSLSSGAACAAAAGRDSHVLAALGLGRAEARASLRLGWGRFTTRGRGGCGGGGDRQGGARAGADGRMIRVRFARADGSVVEVEAAAGARLLDVAQGAGMPLEGTCDGAMACATCHVVLTAEAYAAFAPPTPEEEDMLDFAPGARAGSRLSCQLRLSTRRSSLDVRIPD